MFGNKDSKKIILSFLLGAILSSTVSLAANGIFNKKITATYGRIKLNYNGKDVTKEVGDKYDSPAFTVDGRAYVPVRAIGEIMGIDVSYDHKTHTAHFTDGDQARKSGSKFDHVPEGIQLANLGTSHAQYALIYDDLDMVSFDFSMPAQRLYYDHKLLEKHIDKFEEDARLIIPISYISFYLGYDNDNFKQFNKNYYNILDFKDLKNVSKEEYLEHMKLPIVEKDPNKEDKYKYADYTIPVEEMITEGSETSKRHLDFIKEGQGNKEEFVGILEDIIKLSLENNINPVLTTTPLTKYYNDHFSDEFYKDFRNTIEDLIAKYPNVKYLDYSHDERFINSPEFFFDSSHMNLAGGKRFTDIIMKDIGIGLK